MGHVSGIGEVTMARDDRPAFREGVRTGLVYETVLDPFPEG